MGTHDLIDGYIRRLEAATRWHGDQQAMLAEVRDHLECATESLEGRGHDHGSAQEAALERFGQPESVARAMAIGPQDRPALPTRSTVSAAAMPIVSAGLWMLHVLASLAVIHLYDRVGDSGPDSSSALQLLVMVPWAVSLIGAVAMLLVSGLAFKERLGGFRWSGWLGLGMLSLALPASLLAWATVGWATLVAVGAALLALELFRSEIAPRWAALALATGALLGFAVFGVLRVLELGSPDEWGNYPVATSGGLAVGVVVLAAGLLGLGRWLHHEEPADDLLPARGGDLPTMA